MLGGEVFEGEEGAEAACEGLGFGGEGVAEGQDGGVVCRIVVVVCCCWQGRGGYHGESVVV